eukprot:gnl/TRDRNA2_/TRDRNA2_181156_c0_seq1.p1 gnl/TRDRNA2_/TRDRNA2_181156_c0~~gnl/TRDRNA2_/TRDRNA2_181156_c0_seq1.p1  ORF type:complete len:264 (+),score=60.10 gnl/TRDRNA2_/TRDRNA2_181156_c0_seq1:88-879(+)
MAASGVVKFFDTKKGWGFINQDGKTETIFCHIKHFGDRPPNDGDKVKFDIVDCDKKPGMLEAINITGGTGAAYIGGKWVGLDVGGEPLVGKMGDGKHRGIVSNFSPNGWGFIHETATGKDHFVHIADCWSRPVPGDEVAFDIDSAGGKRGAEETKAVNVSGGTAPIKDGKGHDGKGKGKNRYDPYGIGATFGIEDASSMGPEDFMWLGMMMSMGKGWPSKGWGKDGKGKGDGKKGGDGKSWGGDGKSWGGDGKWGGGGGGGWW